MVVVELEVFFSARVKAILVETIAVVILLVAVRVVAEGLTMRVLPGQGAGASAHAKKAILVLQLAVLGVAQLILRVLAA